MQIGPYQLENAIILAPMAGVTDTPFRQLCLKFGASMAVGEMMSSNPRMWHTAKSQRRLVSSNNEGLRCVQIAGSDPFEMAEAAQYCVEQGAQIVDINMGCPVKKVNRKLAGSALLKHPDLIEKILKSVVAAVNVPVTLKTRTGWDQENKNCVAIAKLAQDCGIQALTLHGRTRACMYRGDAEYQSILDVKQAVNIPVIANGDIDSAQKAKQVLEFTGADGLMIGRAAQGNPWIFMQIRQFLSTGRSTEPVTASMIKSVLFAHIEQLHQFYGVIKGAQIARKHVGWYLRDIRQFAEIRNTFNAIDCAEAQLDRLRDFFENLALLPEELTEYV